MLYCQCFSSQFEPLLCVQRQSVKGHWEQKAPLCVLGCFFLGSEVHGRAQLTVSLSGPLAPSAPVPMSRAPQLWCVLNCLYHKMLLLPSILPFSSILTAPSSILLWIITRNLSSMFCFYSLILVNIQGLLWAPSI